MSLNKFLTTLFVFLFVCCLPLNAAETTQKSIATITVDSLFDKMEKKTETINSVNVEVELTNDKEIRRANLFIKNPDKFAIEFSDGSYKVYFNGKKLWIYIKELNEVFYHEAGANKFFSKMDFINPRKIFTKLTRATLFTLFNIKLISQSKTNQEGEYVLDFVPKLEGLFDKIFNAKKYWITFSEKNYLPVKVVEFDKNGDQRGALKVLEYKINTEINDSRFNFIPDSKTSAIPLTVVIAQKVEQYLDDLKGKAVNTFKDIKDLIMPW